MVHILTAEELDLDIREMWKKRNRRYLYITVFRFVLCIVGAVLIIGAIFVTER